MMSKRRKRKPRAVVRAAAKARAKTGPVTQRNAIADRMDRPDPVATCTCGDVADEHGGDPEYPGSTECTVDGCECLAFESAGPETES